MAKRKPAPQKEEKRVIPLKERPGYCRVCAGHSYKLRFENRELIRKCNGCNDEIIL
jgi:hypothetical protein